MDKIKIGLIFGYIGILVLLNSIFAETIYAGKCNSIEFPNTDPVKFFVEGNSSNMEGFTFNKIGTNITYCFHILYKPDNFTITFYNYQSVTTNGGSSLSGGGICRYNKNFNWNCSEWGGCSNGTKVRICKAYNNCHTTYGKPNETLNCSVVQNTTEPIILVPEEKLSLFRRIINFLKRYFR